MAVVVVSRSLTAGTPCGDVGAEHRKIGGDVMVDQGLESGDSHEAAKLATGIKETYWTEYCIR